MNVHWIGAAGIETGKVEDLRSWLGRDGGFVWVDVPRCDEASAGLLAEVFGFHPLAIRDCRERNHLPKVHAYLDHLFVILHAPVPITGERLHLLEFDQFVGRRYLVTIRRPAGDGVPDALHEECQAALQRIRSGRYRPRAPIELSYALVSGLARRMEVLISAFASRVDTLEQRVMSGHRGDPEAMLESMFHMRHELLTLRTIAAYGREAYARITALAPRLMPTEERPLIQDMVDQFDRFRSLCDAQLEFLRGVIDFYQNKTITKLNLAMERLALITVLLLPVTAIASVYGMNIIVHDKTDLVQVGLVLAVIAAMMVTIFLWARRRGWW